MTTALDFSSEEALEATLAQMPQEIRDALHQAYEQRLAQAPIDNPVAFFPFHDQQAAARRAFTRWLIIIGGNRSGKTVTLKSVVADVLRRVHPINDRLAEKKDRWAPLRIWVVAPTGEKVKSDWTDTVDPRESMKAWLGDLYLDDVEHPHRVYHTIHGDEIWFKTHDQDLKTFEVSSVDLVVWDEEPADEDGAKKVNSTFTRVATTNGVVIMGFTPLSGMSWTYDRWYQPLVENGRARKIGDRHWATDDVTVITMGMADNPEAAAFAAEMARTPGITEAEKAARLFGKYGFTEGVFLEMFAGMSLLDPLPEHAIYVLDELPKRLTGWYVVADPNRRFGAVHYTCDNDGNLIFLREHLKDGWITRQHANVILEWEKTDDDGRAKPAGGTMMWADPGGAGTYAMAEFLVYGLAFLAIEKPPGSISFSIKKLRAMASVDPAHVHPLTGLKGAPRVYFHRPTLKNTWRENGEPRDGSRLVWQLGAARQKAGTAPDSTITKDQKHSWDLFDCARYAALVTPELADFEPVPRDPKAPKDGAVMGTHLPREQEPHPDPYANAFYVPEYAVPSRAA